jgi:ADP-ribosylglycohydrolase
MTKNHLILGAVAGDIIGSPYEFSNVKTIGGDSDTIACVAGAIAEAFYGEIPAKIADTVSVILGPDLLRGVIMPFSRKCGNIEKGE